MVCTKCGSDNLDEAIYCGKCGSTIVNLAEIAASTQESAAKSPAPDQRAPGRSGKKLLLITGIAAILVVLGVAAFAVIRNFGRPNTEDSRFYYTDSPLLVTGEEETLIYNGSSKPVTIKGRYVCSAFSMDRKKCVILVDRDNNETGTLYYFDGAKAKELSEDVFLFTISADGSGVAYLTDPKENFNGTLNLYDASRDKSREVADDASAYMTLSPDGNSIAYISYSDQPDQGSGMESFTSYISVNGKAAELLDSDTLVIGLANDAKYVYYLKSETDWQAELTLYVRHGKINNELGSTELDFPFTFNRDLSEILYSDNENMYLSKAGEKRIAADRFLGFLYVPYNSQMSNLSSDTINFHFAMYNIKELTGQSYLYKDSDGLRVGYLDQELSFSETNAIPGILDRQTQWTADGKGLYYPDDTGRLQYLKDVSDPDAKPVEIESDHFAQRFVVTSDQSVIYFVDMTGTLWIKKGDSDAVAAAEKVMDNMLTLASDGQGLYFIADSARNKETGNDSGTLSYLSGSPDAKVIEIADNVEYVTVSEAGVVYYVFSEKAQYEYLYEAFYSGDGKNFSSVMDNAFLEIIGN